MAGAQDLERPKHGTGRIEIHMDVLLSFTAHCPMGVHSWRAMSNL